MDKQERAIAATEPGLQALVQGRPPLTPMVGEVASHVAPRPVLSLKEQKDALKDGRLLGFHCNSCKLDRISPFSRCPACKSNDIAQRQFSSTGKVVSYTIQSVAAEQFLNETPFAFALIQLDDGPRVSGWIPWIAKPKDLPMGQKVEYVSSYKPGMQFEKR
ncbi:MAG TPA: OB-fold domain-containing protein [Candidatus Thermoplasmatota archaeon]|nr:OB-fold domain-containing protein [Candidatus Thermoplasmatota archaeon]